jgi:hypothetical protein
LATVATRLGVGFLLVLVLAASQPPTQATSATSPFPSPTPVASPSPTPTPLPNPFVSPSPGAQQQRHNGYIAAGYLFGSASGGQIQPRPGSTSTPSAFPNSGENGFWADIVGRLGPNYLASLEYENAKIQGGDHPLVSYAQLRALYEPKGSSAAFGIGLLSAQRSTLNANFNSIGPGIAYVPNPASRFSPYAWLFYYPHIQTSGSSSSLFSAQAGLQFAPKPSAGLFLRAGISTHCCFPAITSPKSDFGVLVGLGSTF